MTMPFDRRSMLLATGAVLAVPFAAALSATRCAAAQQGADDEVDDMARALRPRTRRGGPVDRLDAERQTLERLKSVRKRRGLTLQERDELYDATRKMPSLDLEILFAFDSANILPEGAAKLDKLGRALSRGEFTGNTFLIAGHTDHKGTAEYNLMLSERRASAVANYLISKFSFDADSLTAVGYGFERLKNPSNPLSGENRRVEIVNGGR